MVTLRSCVWATVISIGLTGDLLLSYNCGGLALVPWTMDIQPNVTKLTVMETHWSCCFKGLDTDGLHHSAQFPLSWVLFSCSKVSSVYFGVHLRDCAKQHTGIHCICQRTRRPMQTFPRQEERSSKFHGLFWQETDLRVGGYIKTRRKLVSLIKRGVCVKSLACNAYIWAFVQKASLLHSTAPSGLHGTFSCFTSFSRGAEI